MDRRKAPEVPRFFVRPGDRGGQGDGAVIRDRERSLAVFAECGSDDADWVCAALNAHHKRDQGLLF